MAKPTSRLINALRQTAKRLRSGAAYQWGHLGSCNCGHLAQTLTNYSKGEIHTAALARHGDWGEVSEEYCPNSGKKIDEIIETMLIAGLNIEDIEFLENLSDPKVLSRMKVNALGLRHNVKLDVITYMEEWSNMLESQLPLISKSQVKIDEKHPVKKALPSNFSKHTQAQRTLVQ